MFKAILDTDTLSELFKGRSETVLQNAARYLAQHGQLTLTSVSVYEVLYGLNAKNAVKQMREFFTLVAPHEEITPGAQDYRWAGEIRAALQRAGTPIGALDPLIAACALTRGLPLVTGNTRHYGFVQDAGYALQLVNWREVQP